MKNFIKNFTLLLFSLIFTIYLVEGIFTIISPSEEKNLTNINEIRIKNAKQLNKPIDLRSPNTAFRDMSRDIKNLTINYRFNPVYFNFKTFKEAKEKGSVIPLRGPINKPSLTCAEDLTYKVSSNDRLGFKNSDETYNKKIDLIILGDSFAEGWCYDEKDDVAGLLRKKNINSLNFGVAGAGPLLSLAVMKEYVGKFKPKYMLFFYCEANDLIDLNYEKNNFLLKKYLSDSFSQNLIKKFDEKKLFLENIDKEIITKIFNERDGLLLQQTKKEILYERLKDFFEISKIKTRLKPLMNSRENNKDQKLFFEIMKEMDVFSKTNDTEFIFVYLPAWERYFSKFSKYNNNIAKKNYILDEIEKMDIHFIDIDKAFSKEDSLEVFFPLHYYGHYSRLGYKKVTETILANLKKDEG